MATNVLHTRHGCCCIPRAAAHGVYADETGRKRYLSFTADSPRACHVVGIIAGFDLSFGHPWPPHDCKNKPESSSPPHWPPVTERERLTVLSCLRLFPGSAAVFSKVLPGPSVPVTIFNPPSDKTTPASVMSYLFTCILLTTAWTYHQNRENFALQYVPHV